MADQKSKRDAEVEHRRKSRQRLQNMEALRQPMWSLWRDIMDYFMPRKYPSLLGETESRNVKLNTNLLDSTSSIALRTLAAGMMNGITSPERPWMKLKDQRRKAHELTPDEADWFDQCEEIMAGVFAESNFYNAVAVLYYEWAGFGTGAMSIREDYEDVIRCVNHPCGSYYIECDAVGRVVRFGRKFKLGVEQMVEEFGIENVPTDVKTAYKLGGANLSKSYEVHYLLEKQPKDDKIAYSPAPYRELYFTPMEGEHDYLAVRPVWSWPVICPRWEVIGDSTWGVSPAMDALGDVKELQHMRLRASQGLDKMIDPPLIADQQLKRRPKAFGAGGVTYAPNINSNFGAKPLMQLQVPYQEMNFEQESLRGRIKEALHNNLFNMISQLDTVRSATEIDARREEKLIFLGPVLTRFYDEGLKPIVKRVFNICQRADMFPPAPESLSSAPIDVEFVSILADAQKASDVSTIERFLMFAGNLAGVYPEAREVPDAVALLEDYGKKLGIRPGRIKSREQIEQAMAAQGEQQQLAQMAAVGKDLAQGAGALAGAEVGGGMNALQAMAQGAI